VRSEPNYEVVAPVHQPTDSHAAVNRRPPTLDHKTVAFVWDYLFDGPTFFAAIRRDIERRFCDVRFLDYEQFGNISFGEPERIERELPMMVRTAGADVAVVAVGA
jgi:hypothetical protein